MRVRFTPCGRIQFLDAVSYIARDNPSAAIQFRRRAERALRRLRRFPESGRLIPEFPDLPFREVIVPPYRFFYRREDRTIWVVACWHGAQLPAEPKKQQGRVTIAFPAAKKELTIERMKTSDKRVIGVGRFASGLPDLSSNKKHRRGFGR